MNRYSYSSAKEKLESFGFAMAMLISIILILVVASNDIEITSSGVHTTDGDSVTDRILTKTVMIYLDGADLEPVAANATASIREIIESDVDTDSNNILIYTGGCNAWRDYDIPADKDCIYLIRDGELKLLEEYGASNVGDPGTLERFMSYCVRNYPAEQYGLILQDHGGGPFFGVCQDERNGYDALSMAELQSAFSSVGFGGNNKMEFIIFDACLMSSIETAHCMKNYANYMVASENVSYACGSDYSFIETINSSNSGRDIGIAYVDRFYYVSNDLFDRIDDSRHLVDVTYSCLDLSKVDEVEDCLDDLFAEINESDTGVMRASSRSFDARGVAEYLYNDKTDAMDKTVYDLVDIKDWTGYLDRDYPDEVSALHNAIDELVVYNKSNTPHMNGVTIFCPQDYWSDGEGYDIFEFSDEYTEFVRTCYERSADQSYSVQWSSIAPISQEKREDANVSGLSVALTEEQAQTYASATYYILAKYDIKDYEFADDDYVIVSYGNDVTLDRGSNVLNANYDKRVPYVKTADGETQPFCSMLFRNVTDGNVSYYMNAGLMYVPSIDDYPYAADDPDGIDALGWTIDNMRLDVAKLTLVEEGGKLNIVFAEKTSDDNFMSRLSLDVNSYQDIEFMNFIRTVKFDSEGRVLPVDQWKAHDNYLSITAPVEGTEIEMRKMSKDVKYYGLIVMEDIYGGKYTTNIEPLK